MKKGIIILVVAIIVIGGGIGYFQWQKQSAVEVVVSNINPLELLVFEVKNENLSEYQINRDFERFTNSKNRIIELLAAGESWESDNLFHLWLDMASVLKAIGDYDGAAQLWIWFNDAYIHNSVSPANLGNLYKSFVVDRDKSEYYYKMAVERDDRDWHIYYGFYELYRYNFEDADRALDVLRDGYGKNPDQINYVIEMANYLIILERIDEASDVIEEYVVRHPEADHLRDRLK
jgi:tetratricopeptide (TPR) repeat protein